MKLVKPPSAVRPAEHQLDRSAALPGQAREPLVAVDLQLAAKGCERTFPGCPGRYGAGCTRLGLCSHPIRALVPPKAAGPVDRRLGRAGTRSLALIEAHRGAPLPSFPTPSAANRPHADAGGARPAG